MKLATIFEDLKPKVDEVFTAHQQVVDCELQQRANEYKVMVNFQDQTLIQEQIWQAMPEFPERESALVKKDNEKAKAGADRNIFAGTAEEHKEATNVLKDGESSEEDDSDSDEEVEEKPYWEESTAKEAPPSKNPGASAPAAAPDWVNTQGDFLDEPQSAQDTVDFLFGQPEPMSSSSTEKVLEQDKSLLTRCVVTNEGLLYEDDLIQIGMKMQVDHEQGMLKVKSFYGNKTGEPFEVTTNVIQSKGLQIDLKPSEPFTIEGKKQVQQFCRVLCKQPYPDFPRVEIKWKQNDGTVWKLEARYPFAVTKFIAPLKIQPQDFAQRWSQLRNEAQQIIKLRKVIEVAKLRNVVSQGLGFDILENIDKNPDNSVACGTFHTATANPQTGKFVRMPVLLRIELNTSSPQHMIRATSRSPHQLVSNAINACLKEVFGVRS